MASCLVASCLVASCLIERQKAFLLVKLYIGSCLQELNNVFVKKISHYRSISICTVGRCRLYTKRKPLNVTYGVGIEEHDTEGRLITCEFETFYLITACEYLFHHLSAAALECALFDSVSVR